MTGISRRATRPHLDSVLAKLWRAHVERMIAREAGKSQAAAEAKIRERSQEALLHGLTPVELKIKLAEMAEQTSAEHLRGPTKNGATMTKMKSYPLHPVKKSYGWTVALDPEGHSPHPASRTYASKAEAERHIEARMHPRWGVGVSVGATTGSKKRTSKRSGMKSNMDRRERMAMVKAFPEGAEIDEARMTITFELDQDEGEPLDCVMPFKFGVCGTCDGKGSHVNPSIDSEGITGSEMEELGPEFMEDYMGGTYDVPCAECAGQRVVPVIDEARSDKKCLDAFHKWQEDQWAYAREVQSERDFGA